MNKFKEYVARKDGESAMQYVNRTKFITCHSCKTIIYELRESMVFKLGDILMANDFKGVGFPDPISNQPMICPECLQPILLDGSVKRLKDFLS